MKAFNNTLKLAIALLLLAANVAFADSLIIILDISSSTPIVEPNFMRTAMPIITEKIRHLPLGSNVDVFTVGDDKRLPLNMQFHTQRFKNQHGNTVDALTKIVPATISVYLNNLRENADKKMHGESSLSPAFLDASKLCQDGKPSEVVFLSDGMEYQPNVIAFPLDFKKPLPPIDGLNLSGMKVTMLGIGQCSKAMEGSCATSQERIQIERHWYTWLTKYGASRVEIRRL